MPIKTYVFWQNILSIHQAAFIRALAMRKDTKVYCAYEEDLPSLRTNMGWTIPEYGAATTYDVRDELRFNELCVLKGTEVCHVFGSYFVLPYAYRAFKMLRTASCRLAWTSEAFDYHGWRGWLRMARCRWHILREAQAFEHIFGMGQLGVDFFSRAGIPKEKAHEFAYLTDKVSGEVLNVPRDPGSQEFLFLYAGQLIHRKGLDLLLRAVSQLPEQGWRLLLIGDGVQRDKLEKLAHKLNIADRVDFMGNQSNLDTQAWMCQADAFVLPSRWDGWGAVVNESLLAGCPAIVSDSCGSATLLRDSSRGHVFSRGDVAGLKALLETQLKRGKQSLQSRESLSRWAHGALDGSRLVDFFCSIVDGDSGPLQRKAPWT